MSAEFAGRMFSISVVPRYGYVNTERMASICEISSYYFLDITSKKIRLLNLSPKRYAYPTNCFFGGQPPTYHHF